MVAISRKRGLIHAGPPELVESDGEQRQTGSGQILPALRIGIRNAGAGWRIGLPGRCIGQLADAIHITGRFYPTRCIAGEAGAADCQPPALFFPASESLCLTGGVRLALRGMRQALGDAS